MSDQFVYQDGQLFRKVESLEATDVEQLNSKVVASQGVVDARKNELELLQAQLDVKSIELEDAESVLEKDKRSEAAAVTLVAESTDNESDSADEATDGTSGEADDTATEQVI